MARPASLLTSIPTPAPGRRAALAPAPGLVLILTCALLFAGCAGTARGTKQSVYRLDPSLSVVDVSRSTADALVVIRYPAAVDEQAAPAYYAAFEQNAIGGSYKPDPESVQQSDRVAQSLIARSNYYSMTLYQELQERLPPDTVLLSPHVVELDGEGRLFSRPLLDAEEVPAVLTVDFGVYSFPDPTEMMSGEPLTFGDLVTPLFTVHADRWLRPSTYGLLVSSEPLLGAAWLQSRRESESRLLARSQGRFPEFRRSLDFIAFLDRGDPAVGRVPVKRPGDRRGALAAVESHPLEKLQMDGELVDWLSVRAYPDPFAKAFAEGAATRVATALNRVDHDRATFFARQAALARFDPELAAAVLSGNPDEPTRARLQMAEALLEAERRFVGSQSQRLYAGAYEGDYGAQMRQVLVAEHRLLEQRRELAVRQNVGAALAVVAFAGAAYIGSNVDVGDFWDSTAENLLLLGSVWAADSAFRAHAQSRTYGENFLVQMAPAMGRQVTVQFEWLQSQEQISANDLGEFREKTLALYQRSVRAIPSREVGDCRFLHPALDIGGWWYGPCKNGLADGEGYGAAVDERGYSLEYVGSANAGLADGSGAMIFRSPSEPAPVFFEGGFRQGLPHGVVKVEKPGKTPRVRQFRSGRDAGVADADDLRKPSF